jgi:hypothetical protein
MDSLLPPRSGGTLSHLERAFTSVRWFIPPYAAHGYLGSLGAKILNSQGSFTQDDLESALGSLYSADGLAAMVCSRYPITPVIVDYEQTIAEAIEAHFLGLHHVAVAGLVPVIEGAGRELLKSRGLVGRSVKDVFSALAEDCKKQGVGNTGEVCSMMDSFSYFTEKVLYANSDAYPFLDGTNRYGIAHGKYRDTDYGRPINFYKTVGAVNFLAFVSAFNANISWFSPDVSDESQRLAAYYRTLSLARRVRTPCSGVR